MLKGLQERLQKELSLILPADTKVKVSAPSERRYEKPLVGFAS